MEHQELLSGLVRLHVLHHAAEDDLYGNWMIEELARHGYKISPGTLYPMLHALERKGYLTSRTERAGSLATPHLPRNTLRHRGFANSAGEFRELVREVAP